MSTTYIRSLNWLPGPSNDFNAQFDIDLSSDPDTQITITRQSVSTDRTINPAFVTVNNLLTAYTVSIGVDGIYYTCAAFKQIVIPLLPNARTVEIIATSSNAGSATKLSLLFSERKTTENDTNNFAVTQLQGATVYAVVTPITSNSNQNPSANFHYNYFAPNAGDIVFNLIDTTLTAVQNGYAQYCKNVGTNNVALTPPGAITIDAVFNNGSPYILAPGESLLLVCDGSNYETWGKAAPAVPHGFVDTAAIALSTVAAATTSVLAHNLGQSPASFRLFLVCTSAELGYSIGDITTFYAAIDDGTEWSPYEPTISFDNTNLYVTSAHSGYTFRYVLNRKDTGVSTELNKTKWSLFARVTY